VEGHAKEIKYTLMRQLSTKTRPGAGRRNSGNGGPTPPPLFAHVFIPGELRKG
jgi:hypothetical protein